MEARTYFAPRPPFSWQLRDRSLALGERTVVMAVLNVTPDSFSDGGLYADTDAAVAQGLRLLDEGADILDIGGESTRPDATPLSAEEELARVLPVIRAIHAARSGALISIDTYKAHVAQEAVAAGAAIVNDVSGFTWDAAMAQACAELACGVIAMHSRGRPTEWLRQTPLATGEVLPLVRDGLAASLAVARNAGIRDESLVLDPGFGFGKRGRTNYQLLAQLPELSVLGRPLLAGVSRKSFLAETISALPGKHERRRADGPATLSATVAAVLAGAHIVRVHDVAPALEAVAIADAILTAAR
jgi:dihydropteroate synthase